MKAYDVTAIRERFSGLTKRANESLGSYNDSPARHRPIGGRPISVGATRKRGSEDRVERERGGIRLGNDGREARVERLHDWFAIPQLLMGAEHQ